MIYSDLDLIKMQAQALFVHDKNGRLLRINERNNPNPAARFFLSRSKSGNLWRTRYDLSPDLTAELERLAAAEAVVCDLTEPPRYATEYERLLQEHALIISTGSGPGYYLLSNQPHDAVMITSENLALLEAHFDWVMTTLPEKVASRPLVSISNRSAVISIGALDAPGPEKGLCWACAAGTRRTTKSSGSRILIAGTPASGVAARC